MGWALLGASSLLIGALIAFAVRIADRLLGFILAFGAGVLISAGGLRARRGGGRRHGRHGRSPAGFALGAVFFAGDVWIESPDRGVVRSWHGLGIVLGAVLDGIPESVVIGASLLTGDRRASP